MNKEFILTILALDELKQLGYYEVWIGNIPNPHWPRHGTDNFIIASPKTKRNGWPALWSASTENFGELGSGNGLAGADQVQRRHNLMPGHYKLINDTWSKD